MRTSDWAGAIAHFSRAIELNPSYVEAYTNRGASKNAMGDFDGALTDLNKVLALDPKAPGIKGIIRIISKKAKKKLGSTPESG
jgi:Flp pilus assembly protein TadD